MSYESPKPAVGPSDESEPMAERGAMPIFLIALFALTIYLGMIYLDAHGGGFDPRVYGSYMNYQAVKDKQPLRAGGEGIIRGKIVFQTCSACHQPDGKGSTALHAPPLAGSDWVQAEGPNRVIRIVLNGLAGPITVSGGQYGEGTMPAFKDAFTDEQIADVLSYVRQEWGNKGGMVKPAEVKVIREKIASKADSWSAPDLLQVPDKN